MSERPKGWVMPVCVLSVLIGLPWRIVHLELGWAGGEHTRHHNKLSSHSKKKPFDLLESKNCNKTGEKLF